MAWYLVKYRDNFGLPFYLRGRKEQETGEDYIMRSFITCTFHQVLLG